MTHSQISRDELVEQLDYDKDTGTFYWKISRRGVKKGTRAGGMNGRGYIQIWIKGKNYRAHRLAWLYVNGEWPSKDLDHINRDKADNRVENLRETTQSENMRNTGRGWTYNTDSRGYRNARVNYTDFNGKVAQKCFSCNKYGWLTAGKMTAQFVLENRPRQYQGASDAFSDF